MTTIHHALLTGSAVSRLPIFGAPDNTLLTIREHPDGVRRDHRVTTLVIVDDLNYDDDLDNWWERESRIHQVLDSTLPLLAPASNGLLVGYTNTDRRRERRALRAGIEYLIAHFKSHAANVGGKDFTMNGIEVPATHNSALLSTRLKQHLMRRAVFAHGVVLPLEELDDQTIAEATAASVL